jgi:site-specific DNA-methyltransferase (adenine-specific)
MGSGKTDIACLETNRHYIGFELSPNYHAIAENRIANYVRTGNTTLPRPKKTNIKKSKTIKMANPDLLEFAQ